MRVSFNNNSTHVYSVPCAYIYAHKDHFVVLFISIELERSAVTIYVCINIYKRTVFVISPIIN